MFFATTFIFLLVTWIVFSGLLDPFHLTLGIISCLIISALSTRLLFPHPESSPWVLIKRAMHFLGYAIWLLKEIIIANLHVFYLAVIPGGYKHLDPEIVELKVRLKSDSAKYLLANSITLTPGTVTISIEDERLLVHSISRTTTEGLEGDMEQRIAKIFGESISES